jgi:hypothetical protein
MGTIRVGEVRFHVWSDDHEPRHIHAEIGSGRVTLWLQADGAVVVGKIIGLNRNEVRKARAAAISAFDALAALWEEIHG